MRLYVYRALGAFVVLLAVLSVVYAADIHQVGPASGNYDFPLVDHSPCARVVKSSGTGSYFVGAKTAAEWQSFYNKVQAAGFPDLSISGCPP